MYDYRADYFSDYILNYYGSMEKVVDEYFNQMEAAITYVTKFPIRKRMGHINLIEKFKSVLPQIDEAQMNHRLKRIIPLLAAGNVGIDVNTAGLRVDTCGKPCVPSWFIHECRKAGVDCIYGSDAHKPEHIGLGWDWFEGNESR